MALAVLTAFSTSAMASVPLQSEHALVVDENSGTVLLEKNATSEVPIASLTKLMTAMVILDVKPNMEEPINIEADDVDTLKHSRSRLPVGSTLPRKTVLHLALMSSDNRAAAALARTYPGGKAAFATAVQAKLHALGMTHTHIGEPTGLSPQNTSTAFDLVKMAEAASKYPQIAEITTDEKEEYDVKGREVEYHNTNRLVGRDGWDILLSKTGYTQEAGRCIIMRMQSAGKKVVVVLLNAKESAGRTLDAMNVRRMLLGETTYLAAGSGRRHSRAGRHPRAVLAKESGKHPLAIAKASKSHVTAHAHHHKAS